VAAFALSGCGDKKPAVGGHDHGAGPVAAADDHHDEGGEKLTDFSEKTELFVEFKPLIAGQSADFVVHLTRLADYKPLAKGVVTVVLAGAPARTKSFVSTCPRCRASSNWPPCPKQAASAS